MVWMNPCQESLSSNHPGMPQWSQTGVCFLQLRRPRFVPRCYPGIWSPDPPRRSVFVTLGCQQRIPMMWRYLWKHWAICCYWIAGSMYFWKNVKLRWNKNRYSKTRGDGMVSLYFFVLYSGFLLPLSFLAMTSFGFSPKEVTSQEQVARDHCRFSHFGANYQPFLCHWRFPCSPTSRTCVHLGLQNLDFNLHSEWQFFYFIDFIGWFGAACASPY